VTATSPTPTPTPAPAPTPTPTPRPALSVPRRIALGAGTLLTAALPVVWGISSAGDLITGTQPDHRFHQVTGQGLLLSALWLGALLPLIVAGWRRRTPPVAAALAHLAVAAAVVGAAILAPGNGGALVAAIIVGTGALLWAALPVRPQLRRVLDGVDVDPVLAPIGLLVTALLTPYLFHQAALQRAMADEHAQLSHYFDMAWVSLIVIAFALLAALLSGARPLALPMAGALLVLGVAGLVFLDTAVWPVLAVALGALAAAAALLRSPRSAASTRRES
jgi:hypothetical protein